ncbi:MAG TPA: YdbH domain-containing protein, partial [Caulobacteraceae bacterium]
FAGRTVSGRFTAFTPGRLDLAMVTLAHDLKTGVGHADIEAQALVFTKNGLQPAILTPLAAFARDAEGRVSFTGRFDWTDQGFTSSGVVGANGLTFKSPLGTVQAIEGQIRLTSLAPLVSAPDQSLTVHRIDAVAAVDGVKATFDFNGQGLTLDTAEASAAKGRIHLEPMQVPFGGDGTIQGALVLDHVDLGDLVAGSSLADSVKVQIVVVGRLPFEIGPGGFHFLQGHISAVRPGRISISRKALTGLKMGGGEASSSGPAVNAVQDLAYEALENLSFETLEADVASRPAGRLGMIFAIKGHYDPPTKQQDTFKLSELLNGAAFQKKIPLPSDTPINLNLDTSLNFDELVTALTNIWKHDTAASRDSGARGSVPVQ